MKKRSLAVLLALVMCLGLLPAAAVAGGYDDSWDVAYPVTGGELHFDTTNGFVKGFTPGVTVADIPDTINGVAVTEIYNYAFSDCTELTKINIPASITYIWESAFQAWGLDSESLIEINVDPNNTNYASIDGVLFNKAITTLVRYPHNKQGAVYNIPDSVTKICGQAFSHCVGIKSVVIPDSVTEIDDWAFCNSSSITNVVIGNGVTSIGSSVFTGCWSLASVTIPSSVTSIKHHAFWNCDALKDVYFSGTEAQWNAIEFDKYDEDTLKILASATIHYNSTGPATQPTTPTTPTTPTQPTQKLADVRAQKIVINGGKTLTLHAFGLKDANGNYTNYVSVRDLAWAMSGGSGAFDVTWDNAAKAINLVTGKDYSNPTGNEGKALFTGSQPFDQNPVKVLVNGKEVKLELINIGGGNTYYKLRDLGDQLGFTVGWDQAAGAATITTK